MNFNIAASGQPEILIFLDTHAKLDGPEAIFAFRKALVGAIEEKEKEKHDLPNTVRFLFLGERINYVVTFDRLSRTLNLEQTGFMRIRPHYPSTNIRRFIWIVSDHVIERRTVEVGGHVVKRWSLYRDDLFKECWKTTYNEHPRRPLYCDTNALAPTTGVQLVNELRGMNKTNWDRSTYRGAVPAWLQEFVVQADRLEDVFCEWQPEEVFDIHKQLHQQNYFTKVRFILNDLSTSRWEEMLGYLDPLTKVGSKTISALWRTKQLRLKAEQDFAAQIEKSVTNASTTPPSPVESSGTATEQGVVSEVRQIPLPE